MSNKNPTAYSTDLVGALLTILILGNLIGLLHLACHGSGLVGIMLYGCAFFLGSYFSKTKP